MEIQQEARKYKLLPHRFLSQYDVSIWMDGNFLIRDDLNELLDRYLSDKKFFVMTITIVY